MDSLPESSESFAKRTSSTQNFMIHAQFMFEVPAPKRAAFAVTTESDAYEWICEFLHFTSAIPQFQIQRST